MAWSEKIRNNALVFGHRAVLDNSSHSVQLILRDPFLATDILGLVIGLKSSGN